MEQKDKSTVAAEVMENDQNGNHKLTPEYLRKKRKRNFFITLGIFLFLILSTTIQTYIQQLKFPSPLTNNVLVFTIVNINIILLMVLIVVIVRNLFKLYMERKNKIIGSGFKKKLILSFIIISFVPSLLLLWVASGFITSSIDNWFNVNVDRSLKNSLEIGQDFYSTSKKMLLLQAKNINHAIPSNLSLYTDDGEDPEKMNKNTVKALEKIFTRKKEEFGINQIILFEQKYNLLSSIDKIQSLQFNPKEKEAITEFIKTAFNEKEVSEIISVGDKELGLALIPLSINRSGDRTLLGIFSFISPEIILKMKNIYNMSEEYRHLQLLKFPIKTSYLTTFLMIAGLILLAAIWLGFYLAKGITVPIQELALATKAVARGDLNVKISVKADDEIDLLINSFNQMAADLQDSRAEVEKKNADLKTTNIELDQRRNYIETIMENIKTGVISIDKQGKISMINKEAKDTLEISEDIKDKNYREVLDSSYLYPVRQMLKKMYEENRDNLEEEIEITVEGKMLNLLVNISVLDDHNKDYLGLVIVFDDLTELIKTQKIAAWREVARGIAHEVKNPLTPIKLNTQRLRKKFSENSTDFPQVFDESTKIIIKEVDRLKTLVDDFSNFARMSVPQPKHCSLHNLIDEVILLYQGLSKNVTIEKIFDPKTKFLNIDEEQMKRVFINLIENSLEAMNGEGKIFIRTSLLEETQRVKIEIMDNGIGIPPENKDKLFWPYFSTKKNGTGLGLAIVNRIITDHKGMITIKDNPPSGAIFELDLPV